MIDALPVKKIPAIQSVWPWPGEPTSVESVGYDCQPPAAAPIGTKNETIMQEPATTFVQNDIRFSVGNAMSRAPIMRGIRRFPNAPMRIGVIAKKIISVPCIVKNDA